MLFCFHCFYLHFESSIRNRNINILLYNKVDIIFAFTHKVVVLHDYFLSKLNEKTESDKEKNLIKAVLNLQVLQV